ncbi:MAG: hypothetical protein U1E53_16780 [Dongiaceae bacterium]
MSQLSMVAKSAAMQKPSIARSTAQGAGANHSGKISVAAASSPAKAAKARIWPTRAMIPLPQKLPATKPA